MSKKKTDLEILMRKAFGKRFQKMREQLQLTQGDVARMCCCSESTVCLWEKGVRTPMISQLKLLQENFNVSLDTMFAFESELEGEVGKRITIGDYEIYIPRDDPELLVKLLDKVQKIVADFEQFIPGKNANFLLKVGKIVVQLISKN